MGIGYLEGKILESAHIEYSGNEGDVIYFHLDNGEKYKLCHLQDCCEEVWLESVIGDLEDLCGSPMLYAREDIKEGAMRNTEPPIYREGTPHNDSETWTFYNLGTIKGSVNIR